MSSSEMPGPINDGERKLNKIAELYSPLFCKSLVHTSYLKENPRPLCKCYSLCSDCRGMTGRNTVLTEEWDCGAGRFVCALICKLCDFMEGCTIYFSEHCPASCSTMDLYELCLVGEWIAHWTFIRARCKNIL